MKNNFKTTYKNFEMASFFQAMNYQLDLAVFCLSEIYPMVYYILPHKLKTNTEKLFPPICTVIGKIQSVDYGKNVPVQFTIRNQYRQNKMKGTNFIGYMDVSSYLGSPEILDHTIYVRKNYIKYVEEKLAMDSEKTRYILESRVQEILSLMQDNFDNWVESIRAQKKE